MAVTLTTLENQKEEEIEYYNYILKNIEQELTSENFNTTDLDNGKDKVIEKDKLKIVFTTTQNQKKDIIQIRIYIKNVIYLAKNAILEEII